MDARTQWIEIDSNDRLPLLTYDVRMRRQVQSTGGNQGVIIRLTLINDAANNPIYTAPVGVGGANDTFQLQVDTGSSDLWIASRSCNSDPCTNNKAKLYDPSAATSSGVNFHISYLSGEVDGSVVWDKVSFGGYQVNSQSLAAATNVVNETLGSGFSGILGLALPMDSVIAQAIPPKPGSSAPDGATLMSNIFGLPFSLAPSQFFYSLLLERPGSSSIPSILGIGCHPSSDLLPNGPIINATQVAYSSPLLDSNGAHFWKSELRAVTVYVNGTARSVDIGHSTNGDVFPSAILDSGVPSIIATPAIANAIWGALGINPAADGNYYLPCTTPLNMTVTLDDRGDIPLHPLDLSAVPQQDATSQMCTGLVQQSSALASLSNTGDVILGVPFLRNVYTVMAYEPVPSHGAMGGQNSGTGGKRVPSGMSPRLGLLSVTNVTLALEEFHKVRVLGQPLEGSTQSANSPSRGLPVGVLVLFGLIGFAAFCAALFGLRWYILRRKMKNGLSVDTRRPDEKDADKVVLSLSQLDLARGHRPQSQALTEDTQRTFIDPFARLDAKYATISSRTKLGGVNESGFRKSQITDDMVLENEDERPTSWIDSFSEYQPALHGEWRPPMHDRTYSSISVASNHSVTQAAPLLDRPPIDREVSELGLVLGMAGIGTARRGSIIDDELTQDMRHSRISSADLVSTPPHPRQRCSRVSFGPRPQSTMSQVVNAKDLR